MPNLDDDDISNAPSIIPDRDELDSYQRHKQARVARKEAPAPDSLTQQLDEEYEGDYGEERGGNALLYVIAVIALLGVAAAGYLFMQLQNAQQRVAVLEQRLSSTDASVSQSSGELQIKINEVNEALTQLRDDTLKKYKTQIDQQGAQIASLDKAGKSVQATIAANAAEQTKAVETLRSDVNKYAAVADQAKQRADQHQPVLDTLSSRVKNVSDAQVKLDARLSSNEEWVESINTFRKQMNREIVNIKQQLAGGKPPAPAADMQ